MFGQQKILRAIKSRASHNPTIALTKGQHDSTKQVYREWLKEKTGKPVGGKVAWEENHLYMRYFKIIRRHGLMLLVFHSMQEMNIIRSFNKYIYTMCK